MDNFPETPAKTALTLGSGLKLWSSLLSRPELKFGLMVASPLKRTERELDPILSPF